MFCPSSLEIAKTTITGQRVFMYTFYIATFHFYCLVYCKKILHITVIDFRWPGLNRILLLCSRCFCFHYVLMNYESITDIYFQRDIEFDRQLQREKQRRLSDDCKVRWGIHAFPEFYHMCDNLLFEKHHLASRLIFSTADTYYVCSYRVTASLMVTRVMHRARNLSEKW